MKNKLIILATLGIFFMIFGIVSCGKEGEGETKQSADMQKYGFERDGFQKKHDFYMKTLTLKDDDGDEVLVSIYGKQQDQVEKISPDYLFFNAGIEIKSNEKNSLSTRIKSKGLPNIENTVYIDVERTYFKNKVDRVNLQLTKDFLENQDRVGSRGEYFYSYGFIGAPFALIKGYELTFLSGDLPFTFLELDFKKLNSSSSWFYTALNFDGVNITSPFKSFCQPNNHFKYRLEVTSKNGASVFSGPTFLFCN